jgi:hypothetical protein
MSQMKKITSKIKKILIFCLFNLFIVALILFVIEGFASIFLLLQEIARTPPLAERSHTQYDEQLGWTSVPNLYIKDMYGPGRYLKTNAQGFRNDQDFSEAIPDHKLRIICSGDSFTLGYGVDNRQTWCQQLTANDPRLETVNMGQGGYGIDQVYLWYKRDGTRLKHDIHLFAFITHDFARMQQDNFLGYGKPRLTLQDNQLFIENVPVPKRAFYTPWLTQNGQAIKELKSVQLLSQLFQRPAQANALQNQERSAVPPQLVAAKILEDLQRINKAQGSILILVYLPTLGDVVQPYPADVETWRQRVGLAAKESRIPFIDLVDDFRALGPDQLYPLFIQEGELDFPGAAGHYSVRGNEVVARRLYEALISLPEVASRLAEKDQ